MSFLIDTAMILKLLEKFLLVKRKIFYINFAIAFYNIRKSS